MPYDAIVIGGGLAGSALSDQLARSGRRVLLLEREKRFKDRVRGENMLPWGVAAARRLGIFDDLIAARAHPAPIWQMYVMGEPNPPRDMRATTPNGDPMLNMFHPDMQEAVLARAFAAGAEIKRGAVALGVECGPGRAPTVTYEQHGELRTVSAPLVVGADGRGSRVRGWVGFEVQRNPDFLTIAGMLIGGTDVPEGCAHFAMGPGIGSFWAPLGGKRSRTYFVYPGIAGRRGLSGKNKVAEFLRSVQSVGVPESWLAGAESIGPLAEFEAADRWVPSPVRNGVALIGDAAAASDPSWGSGLSLTLLDVEHLANALLANDDWNTALEQYARDHDEYYGALHRILGWMTELVWTPGPEANERRMRVFPKLMNDPAGYPDLVGLGPFGPSDDEARRLILGLD